MKASLKTIRKALLVAGLLVTSAANAVVISCDPGTTGSSMYPNIVCDAQGHIVVVCSSGCGGSGGASQNVEGTVANGASVTNVYPVLVAGSDGTLQHSLLSDTSGHLIVNVNGTVPVSGTFWQATQPVSIAATVNAAVTSLPALPAGTNTIGTVNIASGQSVGITGTVPVSGTFYQTTQPVSIAATVNTAVTSLPALPTGSNQIGSVSISNSPTVTISGTVPVSLSSLPALPTGSNTIGTVVATGATASGATPSTNPVLIAGYSGTAVESLSTDSSGRANVNINGTVPVSGTFWQTTQPVSIASLPALPTGSNTIGSVGITGAIPAGSNAIGSVTVTSLPALPTGSNSIGNIGTVTAITGITNALPAGTNVIGTVNVEGLLGALNDGSGTITTGGTSQQVFAADATRRYLLIQNLSTGNLYINFGSAAAVGAGSILLLPNASFVMESTFISNQAVNIIGATTGQAFTAKQL